MNEQPEIIPHLFRTEYRKIVSVLCTRFGLDRIEIAEDIAGDTFMAAAENWSREGVPEKPVAWLYAVAKNKTLNYLNRKAIFRDTVQPEITYQDETDYQVDEINLSPQNIKDSQLQMMFAICHPSIPEEAQIGLALRILCGFGIDEIAEAFLESKETINKRLYRARKRLKEEKIKIELPKSAEVEDRLETVLATIYLLFSEGYYSSTQNKTLRKDLCVEAIRLCHMLVENPETDKPQVNALLALMCFQTSRIEARMDQNDELILYRDQDESLWNDELITKGAYFLNRASTGKKVSTYHIEAAIAWWHTKKSDSNEKWENILKLYNQLLKISYSPIAALNRIVALSKVKGKKKAISEAKKLKLTDDHFYHTLFGELYSGVDNEKARKHYQKAYSLAKTDTEKKLIQNYIRKI